MSLLANEIHGFIGKSSFIRKMFEAGIELKHKYGEDSVYDFSLGNPDLPPPPAVAAALHDIADDLQQPLTLGYMPNAGYPAVRRVLAERLAREQHCDTKAEDVILTCGAAGALNACFRAILNPGDEVLCPTPYFVEYGFYVSNFGGKLKTVPSQPDTFDLDLDALAAAITPKTRAVLINSPNNPTGQVYTSEALQGLADLLRSRSQHYGHPIMWLSDEPYRFLTYDGIEVPPFLPLYSHAIVVGSFSKSLSLAGERVGYLAVNPTMPDKEELVNGIIMTNRILGYVNAPAIGQRILLATGNIGVDVSIYDERRQAMAAVLRKAGIEFMMPKGAFYFFPKVPGEISDLAFVDHLRAQRVLAVPGSGFGGAGHFRMTFCVDRRVIERSADSFCRAADAARAQA